jgi:glycerophosphoryl diester phosphodiesterase
VGQVILSSVTKPATGQRPVLAFAHRGGAYHPEIEGLENTLAAFEHAVGLGYTHLETDVHTTSDGVLLAFHDAVLDRVTDTSGEIARMTLAEVRAARIGGRHQVPTLAELFDRFDDATFNIDLKSRPAASALATFLAARDAWGRVIVTSFSPGTLRAFRRAAGPRARTGAHPLEVAAYVGLPSARLARLLTPGRPVALQIPHARGPLTIASRGLVGRAHANGLQVHVWTIDDPAEMRLLLDRGVDGLMTDRTDLLKDVLVERGQWRDEE